MKFQENPLHFPEDISVFLLGNNLGNAIDFFVVLLYHFISLVILKIGL